MDFKILIVEDEKEIREIIGKYLIKEGYKVFSASDGIEGLKIFNEEQPHLAILDVMMPGISGFDVLKEIRSLGDIPVIMLTAKHQEANRIDGFSLGADDYVPKPFSPKELVMRVSAVLKRSYKSSINHSYISYGPFKLDNDNQKLFKNSEEIFLTSKEYQIMEVFLNHIGILLTREQLIEKAFGEYYDGFDRAIDSQIKKIRQKIEKDNKNPEYLKTKYGSGYIFGG
ncbi:MAG: response regulator transcription factor [Clostridiales bacterium]|nr:response regulator transcription factor [Clostridiales bacterium]